MKISWNSEFSEEKSHACLIKVRVFKDYIIKIAEESVY